MVGYIYKITTPNNRVYIGQTINVKRRMAQYRRADKSIELQTLIYRSIVKHGFDKCNIDIIDTADISILAEREIYWIEFYKSNFKKYPKDRGLNLNSGGIAGLINYRNYILINPKIV